MNHRQRRMDRLHRDRLARQLALALDPRLPPPARKRAARYAASLAEKLGVIVRPRSCDWCRRRLPLERHHERHDRPLEVWWLCRGCHRAGDGMLVSGATA